MNLSQSARVLKALERSGAHGIGQVDFLAPDVIDGGPPITRLAARVKDLRDQGLAIVRAGERNGCRIYRLLESYYERYDNGCWLWTGHINPTGYGTLGKDWAHRRVYEAHKGPIPPGMVIDHLCRTLRCVNPDHLEPVTQAQNLRRGTTAVLGEADVEVIRSSDLTPSQLAERFGVDLTTICNVRAGRTWKSEAAGVGQASATHPGPGTDPASTPAEPLPLFDPTPPPVSPYDDQIDTAA